jgi:RNA polymerase sigma-70 factor (ECF subfamily)
MTWYRNLASVEARHSRGGHSATHVFDHRAHAPCDQPYAIRANAARRNVGAWLPEPVMTAELRDSAELAESLQMAFPVLLEFLSPQERAVFLLAEVFDYSHGEIAVILGKSENACRQLLRRAKKALAQRSPRSSPRADVAQKLTSRFFEAVQAGRVDDLMELLDDAVIAWSDGGGRVRAALNPIRGRDCVARFLIGIARKGGEGLSRYGTQLNGQPGLIGFRNGTAQTAMVLDLDQERIRTIYIVVNPDKLQRIPTGNVPTRACSPYERARARTDRTGEDPSVPDERLCLLH